ncbi:alpha/beta hydrolase [Sporobolomyces koalae]|uniref:alpha/beta hydrolase n=1 Tax=Sporobolomyces koalae TaxID=500713 RepID=UPI00316DB69F
MSTSTTSDIVGPNATKFFTKTWLPASGTRTRAVVLFVHGFVEHIRRYDHVFPLYADQGIAVFAFDQRGFGQTAFYTPKHTQGQTTWPKQFADLDFFTQHVREQFPRPTPLFLMGHSMGGAIALAYPTRSPPLPNFVTADFAGVVSTSPLLRQSPGVKAPQFVVKLGSIVGKLVPNLPINAAVKPEDTCRDPEIQRQYAQDKLCKQQGTFGGVGSMLVGGQHLVDQDYRNWPMSVPVLVCHGESDKVTDCQASKEFVDKLHKLGHADAEYAGFEGYYHEMQNEPGQDKVVFINRVIDWILKHAGQAQLPTMSLDTTGTPAIQVSPASPIATEDASSVARESKL